MSKGIATIVRRDGHPHRSDKSYDSFVGDTMDDAARKAFAAIDKYNDTDRRTYMVNVGCLTHEAVPVPTVNYTLRPLHRCDNLEFDAWEIEQP